MMHDTTFYESLGWLIFVPLVVIALIGFFIGPLWVQFAITKREPGTSKNFTFKNYLKWLFEGIVGDTWKFLKVTFRVAAVAVGIVVLFVMLYFIWNAITSGIDQLSVKDVLIFIAILLVLLLFKNN